MKRSADDAFDIQILDDDETSALQDQLRRKQQRLQELQQGLAYIAFMRRREEARAQARSSSPQKEQPRQPRPAAAAPRKRPAPSNVPKSSPAKTPCPEPNQYRETCETIHGPTYTQWLNQNGAEYRRLQRYLASEKNESKRDEMKKRMKTLNTQRIQLLRMVHPDKVSQSSNPNVQKYRHCDSFINSCAQLLNDVK